MGGQSGSSGYGQSSYGSGMGQGSQYGGYGASGGMSGYGGSQNYAQFNQPSFGAYGQSGQYSPQASNYYQQPQSNYGGGSGWMGQANAALMQGGGQQSPYGMQSAQSPYGQLSSFGQQLQQPYGGGNSMQAPQQYGMQYGQPMQGYNPGMMQRGGGMNMGRAMYGGNMWNQMRTGGGMPPQYQATAADQSQNPISTYTAPSAGTSMAAPDMSGGGMAYTSPAQLDPNANTDSAAPTSMTLDPSQNPISTYQAPTPSSTDQGLADPTGGQRFPIGADPYQTPGIVPNVPESSMTASAPAQQSGWYPGIQNYVNPNAADGYLQAQSGSSQPAMSDPNQGMGGSIGNSGGMPGVQTNAASPYGTGANYQFLSGNNQVDPGSMAGLLGILGGSPGGMSIPQQRQQYLDYYRNQYPNGVPGINNYITPNTNYLTGAH